MSTVLVRKIEVRYEFAPEYGMPAIFVWLDAEGEEYTPRKLVYAIDERAGHYISRVHFAAWSGGLGVFWGVLRDLVVPMLAERGYTVFVEADPRYQLEGVEDVSGQAYFLVDLDSHVSVLTQYLELAREGRAWYIWECRSDRWKRFLSVVSTLKIDYRRIIVLVRKDAPRKIIDKLGRLGVRVVPIDRRLLEEINIRADGEIAEWV